MCLNLDGLASLVVVKIQFGQLHEDEVAIAQIEIHIVFVADNSLGRDTTDARSANTNSGEPHLVTYSTNETIVVLDAI